MALPQVGDGEQLGDGNTNETLNVGRTGQTISVGPGAATITNLGSVVTSKVGFYGVTPIVQRAGSAQVALTTALSSVTVTGAYGFALSSGFSALLAQVEEIRAALVAMGAIKGAA